ncbi:ATPase H(+)-transporting accessory protein 2 [Drosophila mojavensis]|nr:ATPase H(+)-transporting accessory protein 2 [Drosophila mojavensis]
MLLNFLTLFLFSAGIRADGELRVLHTPPSADWIGGDQLDSFYLSDVLLATQGHTTSGNSNWSGLVIANPFDLGATSTILVHIQGIYRLEPLETLKVYDLLNSETLKSMDNFIGELDPRTVYDLNFTNHTLGVAKYKHYFGNNTVPMAEPMQHFKPAEYETHRKFLEEVGYMHAVSENLTHLLQPSQVIVIRISLRTIVKTNNYSLVLEAKHIINQAISRLLSAARLIRKSLLFVQTTDREMIADISGRVTKSGNNTNPFKKLPDRDFPIIFNIILWFSLSMALALAIVCYVVATIDPGYDSVIYRVSRKLVYRSNKKKI